MAKVWSFNTTVRNPERIQNFLRVLLKLEGRIFDEVCQEDFFALQIKKRLYKPTDRTLKDRELVNEVNRRTAEEIPDKIVEKILGIYKEKKDADAAMRGRTTAGILNRFGLCIAHKSKGKVVITQLGKDWLDNKMDDQELFFRFLLKWQYPNPLESGYSDFDIKPFIGVLHLIGRVNDFSKAKGKKAKGISKKEFMLFCPSLTHYRDIEKYAEKIISFREALKNLKGEERTKFETNYVSKRIREIFGKDKEIRKAKGDLTDYTDSAIRYFRMSSFLCLRGRKHYVDISPDFKVETDRILKLDNAKGESFSDYSEYFNFLINPRLPELPWENKKDLFIIKKVLLSECKKTSVRLNKQRDFKECIFALKKLSLTKQVSQLRQLKNALEIDKLRSLRFNNGKLIEYIDAIRNTLSDRVQTVTTRPSLDLEWFVSLSLMVLNDAKDIRPSYTLGDDGLPTGFASNIADIECFYETFGMIIEVTLLMGRDQWYAEGQPVMRHLRDFEDKNSSNYKDIYCLFIAPYLHRDTVNTFWNSIKGEGYEGQRQKIIPLTIEQYLTILAGVKKKLGKKAKISHLDYKKLLDSICIETVEVNDVLAWLKKIDSIIKSWHKDLNEN